MNTANNVVKDNKDVIRELCSYRYNNPSTLIKPQPTFIREKIPYKNILSRPVEPSRNKPSYVYSVPSLNPREKRQLPITPTSNPSNIRSYSIEPDYKSKEKHQSRNILTDNNNSVVRALSNRQPPSNIDYRVNFLLNNVQENQHATILKNLIDETLKNPPTRNIYINNQIISYNTCEPKEPLKQNQNLFSKLPPEPMKSPIYANIGQQRDKLNLFKGSSSNYRVLSQRAITNSDLIPSNKTEVPQYLKILAEPIKISMNRMNLPEDNRSKWSISPIKIVPPKKIKLTK